MLNIVLNAYEIAMAAQVGMARKMSSMAGHYARLSHGGGDGGTWDIDIEGACAEMALAKCLNIFWDGSVNTFKSQPDVADFEVRSTILPYGKLIIRGNDIVAHPATIFVLVTGSLGQYIVRGWVRALECIGQDNWLHEPNGRPAAYFVPQSALHPIELLIKTKATS